MNGDPVTKTRAGVEAVKLALAVAPGLLAAYVLAVLAQSGGSILIAWLTKVLIDGLTGNPAAVAAPLPAAVALITAGALRGVLGEAGQFLSAQLEQRMGRHSHDRLYAAVTGYTGLARFESHRFQDQLRLAEQATGPMSGRLLTDQVTLGATMVTIAGLVVSLWVVNAVMAAIVVLSVIPMLWSELLLARRRTALQLGLTPIERRQHFYSTLLSSPEAAKEVRLFGIGLFMRRRMLAEKEHADRLRRGQDAREMRVQGLLALLAALVSGGGIIAGVLAVQAGGSTVGDLSLYLAAVIGVQSGLAFVANALARTSHLLAVFAEYCSILQTGPDLITAKHPVAVTGLRRGVELRDVWFRYSDDQPWVLRGVNLFLPQGAAVAVAGRNGAGKSTLVKLLCRFYDPNRGAVLWDGVNLKDLDPAQLRRRIGVLFQDFMRYDLSAAENIGLGDVDRLGEQSAIEAAARQAGIHDTLASLPRGYATYLTKVFADPLDDGAESSGVLLSGGQWQRVALARALLRRHADLLILDEPSSGLDAVAEREIQTALRAHREGRTSLLISHRMASLRDADLIVVLDGGRVAESGTHKPLMDLGGQYAQLFTAQAAGYREDLPIGR